MKKFFVLFSTLLIIAYMVLALTAFNSKPDDLVCQQIKLVVTDKDNAGFITIDEVTKLFKSNGVYPVGKRIDDIRSKTLEDLLAKHPLVEEAECYKTPAGTICVEVKQRIPLIRIMSNNGDNYYLDNRGKRMPANFSCLAHRVVATGNIDMADTVFVDKLYQLGAFLHQDKFWNAQIEQINVTARQELELVPRVGEHIVFFGTADKIEDKFERLKTFYEKALNQVGWNKYSHINVEFSNQIICTKKE